LDRCSARSYAPGTATRRFDPPVVATYLTHPVASISLGMVTDANVLDTLDRAVRYFADPDVCLAFVGALRWPNGVRCPHCDGSEHSFLSTRRIWKCKGCKRQFSVKVGTVFEDSPIGLNKWLPTIWMLANAQKAISSYGVARTLGVTQKTGWFMLHRIRLAMRLKGEPVLNLPEIVFSTPLTAVRFSEYTRRVVMVHKPAPPPTAKGKANVLRRPPQGITRPKERA
jgi:transposase-like protein